MKKEIQQILAIVVGLLFMTSCPGPNPPTTNNKLPDNVNRRVSTPTPEKNSGTSKIGESDNPVESDSAMIFKVDNEAFLKAKNATDFVRITISPFHNGDLLRVGSASTAWVNCADSSICPLGQGEYNECCRGECANAISLKPPGAQPEALVRKADLPPGDLQTLETTENKIRGLGANDITTQFLVADLYSNWKLAEANQEVNKLSDQLKSPDAPKQLDKLYLPMLRRTGNMYYRINQKGPAEENYKKVIELAPKTNDDQEKADAHATLGQLYQETGRKDEAAQNFKQSEQLYQKQGNIKRATEVQKVINKTANQ